MKGVNWATLKRDPRFAWLWRMLAPAIAVFMFVDSQLTLLTSAVELNGPGANYRGAAVYVNWHKYVPFLCIHYAQRQRWLLMSSAPYLEGVALWCRWMGLTVIRGAPRERSRESLGHLVAALKRGESVALAADGPAGPGFRAKPGCVELARAAGVPIIPVACSSQRGRSHPRRWDQFYQVRNFDLIEVRYGPPIFVDSRDTTAAAVQRVQQALDSLG